MWRWSDWVQSWREMEQALGENLPMGRKTPKWETLRRWSYTGSLSTAPPTVVASAVAEVVHLDDASRLTKQARPTEARRHRWVPHTGVSAVDFEPLPTTDPTASSPVPPNLIRTGR